MAVGQDWRDLPKAEFAFPGPLRDRLVELILAGTKTSTTCLLADYHVSGDPLPTVGARSVLVDSADQPVGLLETTGVRVVRLADVDLQHVLAEGEGDATVAGWRAVHERFWASAEMLESLGDPDFHVDDDTQVVLETFRCVEQGPRPAHEGKDGSP